MQQYQPSEPPSEYNYHSAPLPAQEQSQYGYQPRYGAVQGRKRRDDCCCGCTRKSCIIIAVVSTIVFVIVLIGVSVGVYYGVTGVGNAVTKNNDHEDEDKELTCECNNRKPECKYPNGANFGGTMKCKPGEECYASSVIDDIGGPTSVACRENPGGYQCKRDDVKNILECWCDFKKNCVKSIIGCSFLCPNGTTQLKPSA